MIETRTSRLATLCVLFGLLVVLSIGFGVSTSQGPRPGQVPTVDHLALSGDTYVGQQVQVSGEVVRTDPIVIVAEYERWQGDHYRRGIRGFTVTGLDTTVTRGQALQVYGTLTSEETIAAVNSVVVPAGNILFMYVISALAGMWVLSRLVRGWIVDWATLAIKPRLTPFGPRDPDLGSEAADA